MCGFAGEVRTLDAADEPALRRMSDVLAPRGPDGHGLWVDGRIGLAHRRLKIIDLSERGAQPMTDDELGLTIVFNGCIYNHRELRAELVTGGHEFVSHSDTEVILKAYREWGSERFVDRLVGMFAFAIVDHATGEVVLGRDRLGIKPLYLAETDGAVRFASTLPALLAGGGVDTAIDRVALHHYLSFHSVVPAPRTILGGVRKLRPGTLCTIDAQGVRTERTYWRPQFSRRDEHAGMGEHDWQRLVGDSVRVAVSRRMVADVPVGVLLSGGLDSSLIVGLLAEGGQRDLQTFSIGFPASGGRDGDEFAFSDLVAEQFDTDHHRIEIDGRELVPAVAGAIEAMSEPMVSHDVVAFYLLARHVADHVKVVQSGQGADEIFAGYSWYPPMAAARGDGSEHYAAEFIDRPHRDLLTELTPAYRLADDVSLAYVRDDFARPGATSPLDRALRLDTHTMLVDDPVKRVDNMTMAAGLEARTPFLDHELVELVASCPPELKLAGGGKGILKQVARGVVPDAVIDRPKGYFPVPALSHLTGDVVELVADALHSPAARAREIFDPAYVDRLLAAPNEHLTTLEGNRLWQVGLLELWLQSHKV